MQDRRWRTHVVDAVGVQRGDRAAGGGAETEDGSPKSAAVTAGDPGQFHGMNDGAVTRELVVLVEDVQTESAIGLPVVHCLECDERQPAIDGFLREGRILHAVRPAPDHLSGHEFRQADPQRLGDRFDVPQGHVPLSPLDATDVRPVELTGGRERLLAVALLLPERTDPLSKPLQDVRLPCHPSIRC